MLQSISLRDFVIVSEAQVRFEDGFCVLTGETGAGKSILIDALGLALGSRADSSAVRAGARRADIVAEFRIGPTLAQWLQDNALDAEEDILLLRRVVEADGGSRAFVNGVASTATMLRGIGAKLIEIHGQHASQALLTPDGQRRMLDDYARTDEALQAVANEWKQLRDAQGALERAQSDQRALDLEREQLAWQLGELGPLQPVEGEWEQLGTEQRRLANSAALVEGASAGAQALAEADDSITDRLGQLAQRLRSLIRFDDSIAPILEMVDSASIQAAEAASELAAYARNVDLDAERLAQVERRISTLFDTARKLRLEPDALPDALARARSRMDDIEASRDAEALGRALTQARASYEAAARRLSASRRKAAKTLEKEVGTEIAGLGMAGGRFEIAFEVAEPGPSGTDRIEFRVAGHKGSEPRALGRVASGGELSRIALAITVSAARANPVPTVIFDEADTGVGGAVADSIGQLMRRLGGSCQVLSVTHLPQVAACAHHQLKVEKATDESGASSTIRTLDTEDRIEEIARMLGGSRVTATTRKHARELLQASATD